MAEETWLTIFTPTKNRPDRLAQLAACLENQTVKTGWKWVVWHDGPIVDPAYRDFPVQESLIAENLGITRFREYPLRADFTTHHLNTEWVVYVDDDDLLVNDFVEQLIPHTYADLIQWKMVMIRWMRDERKVPPEWMIPGTLTADSFEQTGLLTTQEHGFGIGTVGMGSFAVRAKISKEVCFPVWNGTGDQCHFIGCYSLADSVVHLPKSLYVYV